MRVSNQKAAVATAIKSGISRVLKSQTVANSNSNKAIKKVKCNTGVPSHFKDGSEKKTHGVRTRHEGAIF